MSTQGSSTRREKRGASRRLVALVVGLLALVINIAAGAIAAQQRHDRADPLVQLSADLAVLCAPDGATLAAHHPGGDGAPLLPHCQSCLPFFASALAPRDIVLAPLAYVATAVEVTATAAPAPVRFRLTSIGARGPPAA